MKRSLRITLAAAGAFTLAAANFPTVSSSSGGQAQTSVRISRPGEYSGYSPRLYDERIRSSRFVKMRDGTSLAIDIYRPAREGKAVEDRYPVIWAMTPYRRAFIADGEIRLSGGLQHWDVRELTDYGYVVAIADARGKGASFGTRRGMTDTSEGQDGYDITQWLAAQPWSTGKIGMTGCSYLGGTQWATLISTPPNLTAVFPGAAPFSRYDFVSRGGMTAQYHTRPEDPTIDGGEGVLPVGEDSDGSLLAKARVGHRLNTPMAEIWKAIPYRDDWSPLMKSRYWEEISVSTYRNRIEQSGVAIYGWSSWKDEFSADQFLHKANLRNPMKVLMLGGEHCAVGSFDMGAEQHRFFDYWLKQIDNGIMDEPPIHYFTFNAAPGREWRSADRWPIPETVYRTYYLDGAISPGKTSGRTTGLNVEKPERQSENRFTVDYSVLKNDGSTAGWLTSRDGSGLSFDTAPFAGDVELTGHPVVRLWVSSTATDGDLFAYLEEVAANGDAVVRSHGRLRASHRLPGTAPFDTMGLPWHRSFRADARPLSPGEPVKLEFDLLPTSTILRKGMKLRLVIAGADPRQRIDPPKGTPPIVTIFSGGVLASSIDLPVIPGR